MNHWSEKYLHLPFTAEMDCFYYFRLIQKNEFGRDLDCLMINSILKASKVMTSDEVKSQYGCFPTKNPKEGDAVYLAQRIRPHHIGIVAKTNPLNVIHAIVNFGVVISSTLELSSNGWKILEFLTWK